MLLLNLSPLTTISPCRPLMTVLMALFLSALRKSELASGGNTLGIPRPVGWWQAAHTVEKMRWPNSIFSARFLAMLGGGATPRGAPPRTQARMVARSSGVIASDSGLLSIGMDSLKYTPRQESQIRRSISPRSLKAVR